jgi:cephalosporin-C deacetylase-like acetyl esterase
VKRLLIVIGIFILFLGIEFGVERILNKNSEWVSPLGNKNIFNNQPTEKPKEKNTGYLAQYNFENLRMRENKASKIKIVGESTVLEEARKNVLKAYKKEGVKKDDNFKSYEITFTSSGKTISGMLNLPSTVRSNKLPAIVMIRGYAESAGYFVGSGSWKAADELARNGFVTISLDFLGYGLSTGESKDILEARFEKPVGVLDLIESVKKLDYVDSTKIGLWSHSNGGQIAISVLEITGQNYPTVLWAPMTNPFPQSVLETMDDSENGKIVKQKIANFEKDYDSKLYSIDNFYEWINSPILIHQGTADVWCKVKWQQDLQSRLQKLGKEVRLDIRQGSDHNLKQSWDEVIKMDIEFFREKFSISP